jgi:hypothetical protein
MSKKLLTSIATLALTVGLTLGTNSASFALDSFDLGVGMFWNSCLSTKVQGTFSLQIKKSGQSNWQTIGTATAWDDRQTEDGSCPKYDVGVFWTPTTKGIFDIRLFNSSNRKSYHAKKIQIGSTTPASPKVEIVNMPRLLGVLDGQAKDWLFFNGYKFSYQVDSTGWNPKLSCLMSGKNVILRQNPQPGTQVENSFNTKVTVQVNCEW